jgi:activator of HSP90 ATPase
MTRAIQQSVVLHASPEKLFHTFLDSNMHSAMTGAPAKTSTKVGGKWSAWGGAIHGRNLLIIPGRMIVQAWRSTVFKKSEPDSILVLTFSKAKGGGRIDLVHVNVPEYDHKGVREGWPTYYWKPWKAYLTCKG